MTPSSFTKNIELDPPADTTYTPGLISCSSKSGPCAYARFKKRVEKRIEAANEEHCAMVGYIKVYLPPVLISVINLVLCIALLLSSLTDNRQDYDRW